MKYILPRPLAYNHVNGSQWSNMLNLGSPRIFISIVGYPYMLDAVRSICPNTPQGSIEYQVFKR